MLETISCTEENCDGVVVAKLDQTGLPIICYCNKCHAIYEDVEWIETRGAEPPQSYSYDFFHKNISIL